MEESNVNTAAGELTSVDPLGRRGVWYRGGWRVRARHAIVASDSSSGLIILINLSPMGFSATEPSAHDARMYKGAVRGRAGSLLRSSEAYALGNRVHLTHWNEIWLELETCDYFHKS